MALTDPQKFKEVAGTEVTAPRVSSGDFKSIYETSDGLNVLSISTQESNSSRKRHLVRIDVSKLTTNPFEETKKQTSSMSVYLVIDRPVAGFTVAEAKKLVEGLVGLLSASTYSLTEKVLGGES
jgi:predicted NUDIX family NTP pyrophosphohydrolase